MYMFIFFLFLHENIFFLFFSWSTGLTFLAQETVRTAQETVCMKCQILFLERKIKKSSTEILPSMQSGKRTRASAQRVTNTPGRRHFLIIKYFKVNDNDIRQDIVYNVCLWVTMIYNPKYNFPGVISLQDMKQICWAIKYRSLTYIYLRN